MPPPTEEAASQGSEGPTMDRCGKRPEVVTWGRGASGGCLDGPMNSSQKADDESRNSTDLLLRSLCLHGFRGKPKGGCMHVLPCGRE